jgi:NAD(P)-dependent dehydrogenase (short-subunit alcohol dehydrogenase family)
MGQDGRWAVVLGVSTGTGAAIARALARDPGMNLYGLHRGFKQAEADEVQRSVEALGRDAWFRTGNASSPEAAREGVAALREHVGTGRVGFLVHSIANASLGPLVVGERPVEPRQVTKTFESMAHSFVYWARELYAQDMLAPEARLLALGNPVTDSLADDLGLIAAAKAALEVYVRQLAIELGPLGHRVNLLKFGLVDTRASQVAFSAEHWPAVRDLAARVTPARRLCTVEEVARFASVLAGPDGAWFNGATIDFTGAQSQSLFDALLHPARP